MRAMKSTAGFTVLEIMIVVSIVALLATIAIPSFMSSRESTQKQLCSENRRLISDMLDLYCLDNGEAPLVGNFGNLHAIKDALVPLNQPDECYIVNRNVFECPASGDGTQHDYDLEIVDGMVIGFNCNITPEHNE